MEMTTLRANLRRTGIYETKGPANPPRIKWQFQTGKELHSSPVIVDDWIYFSNSDGNLFALDIHTGKERWRFRSEWLVGLSPTIDDDTIYFQLRGGIHTLNRITGQKHDEWVEHYISGVLSVVNSVLYIGNYDGLYAVDLGTRKQKWWVRTHNGIGYPAFGEDKLYFGSHDHNLYAVTIDKGRVLWKFKTEWHTNVNMGPTVFGEVVYFNSEDLFVYALEAQTGEVIWKFCTGSIVTALAVTDNTVCFGIWAGQVIALDRKSGQERWRFSTEGEVPSSPCIAEQIVYFGDGDFRKPTGRIYALDLQTGRGLWRLETPNRIWSEPVIANGVLYVGSGNGCLYAIE